MSDNTLPPDPFTCPVCNDCDHDVRGGVLEFISNVQDNLKLAGETLLDALEAEGAGSDQFMEASIQFATVREQLAAMLVFIPEIALVKAASTE